MVANKGIAEELCSFAFYENSCYNSKVISGLSADSLKRECSENLQQPPLL